MRTITAVIFWLMLGAAFVMGAIANLPSKCPPKQAKQVSIPLYSVNDIQTELKARGYSIKIDGKFGPETENALYEAIQENEK